MVDLYKKILAGQLDSLNEELAQMNDFPGREFPVQERTDRRFCPLRKDRMNLDRNQA